MGACARALKNVHDAMLFDHLSRRAWKPGSTAGKDACRCSIADPHSVNTGQFHLQTSLGTASPPLLSALARERENLAASRPKKR